jgi:signal transduction histidine kinase
MLIKSKFVLITMLTSVVVLLMTAAAFVVNDVMGFRTGEKQKMKALAEIIAKNTTAAVMFNDQKSAEDTLTGLSINPHVISAFIVASGGAVFAEYHAPGESNAARSGKSAADIIREARISSSRDAWEGDDDLEVVVPMVLDNQEIGEVVVRSDIAALEDRITRALITVAGIFIAALAIAYLVALKLQRVISGPILHLADTMRSVTSEKNYVVRARAESNDEIGQLIQGFNEMLGQIQQRDEYLEKFATELKESNEELKAFMYSAAHDLRQPLVNIQGFTSELRRSVGEVQTLVAAIADRCSPEERAQLARFFAENVMDSEVYIRASVDRMSSLINALLKLSQAGHRTLKPEPISMNALTRSIIAGFEQQIRKKNATVAVGDLPELTADRTAMEQIMGNLLDNAVKFLIPERPGRVEISGVKTDGGIIYHVRDNGCGISADDMPRLFHLFRRLGRQDVAGDGVGLAYAKALVKRHGGRIWCESELGVGTTFSFAIPVDMVPENDHA